MLAATWTPVPPPSFPDIVIELRQIKTAPAFNLIPNRHVLSLELRYTYAKSKIRPLMLQSFISSCAMELFAKKVSLCPVGEKVLHQIITRIFEKLGILKPANKKKISPSRKYSWI